MEVGLKSSSPDAWGRLGLKVGFSDCLVLRTLQEICGKTSKPGAAMAACSCCLRHPTTSVSVITLDTASISSGSLDRDEVTYFSLVHDKLYEIQVVFIRLKAAITLRSRCSQDLDVPFQTTLVLEAFQKQCSLHHPSAETS